MQRARRFAARAYRILREGFDRWAGARALARRAPGSPERGEGWLREDERRLLEALSAAIVPSDESGAGAREANVVDALNRRLAASPSHQQLYARGLPSFDTLSQKKFGHVFAELSPSEQTDLLREVDRLSGGESDAQSGGTRVVGKALQLYRSVRFPAARLFPVLVEDVMQAFYTNPVSWKWLGYDGPPMPRGYLDPTHPRA